MSRSLFVALAVFALSGCRIERVDQGAPATTASSEPEGEVVVYTSMYRPVVDAIDALAKKRHPKLRIEWFQAGSEKVAQRLDAELSSGGTRADLLLTSDPFFFERLKRDGKLARYASVEGQRTPRSLVDPEGHYQAVRLSTVVLAHRTGLSDPPKTFRALTSPEWQDRVALPDPLTSGTAFTWAVFLASSEGDDYFAKLAANGALVAGGNASVQQRLESGERDVGVLLLENVLMAKARGVALEFTFPEDGAVVVPGSAAILAKSRHPAAARALYDLLLTEEAQAAMVSPGAMHGVDGRTKGPADTGDTTRLLERARPWTAAVLERGVKDGAKLKTRFAEAFAR